MTSDDILRSYEAKRSVCARNWTLFYNIITCNPERTVQFVNDSFFWTDSFSESVHQIRLKRLKHFASWAAQIYKLLKTHFQTLDSQSDSKSSKILMYLILWWMNHSELQFLQQSLNWANSSTRTEDWWAADMSMCEPNIE